MQIIDKGDISIETLKALERLDEKRIVRMANRIATNFEALYEGGNSAILADMERALGDNELAEKYEGERRNIIAPASKVEKNNAVSAEGLREEKNSIVATEGKFTNIVANSHNAGRAGRGYPPYFTMLTLTLVVGI